MGETLLFMAFCVAIWALIGLSLPKDDLDDFWPQKAGKGGLFKPKKASAEKEVDELKTAADVRAYQAEMERQEALKQRIKEAEEASGTAGAGAGLQAIRLAANLSNIKADPSAEAENKDAKPKTEPAKTAKGPSLDDLQALRSDKKRKQKGTKAQQNPGQQRIVRSTRPKPVQNAPTTKPRRKGASLIEATAELDQKKPR